MNYFSITTSEVEWRAAICLCGSTQCRGSFLHYATNDDLQQVLNLNCGPMWRYASLLRACSHNPLSDSDQAVLQNFGMSEAALGKNTPHWVHKFAAANLRFVEYERRALPCALMRKAINDKKACTYNNYSFTDADLDARSVMEQRIQSMVCCVSLVQQVLLKQSRVEKCTTNSTTGTESDFRLSEESTFPLVAYKPAEAIALIWEQLQLLPTLLLQHLVESSLGPGNPSYKPAADRNDGPTDPASSERRRSKTPAKSKVTISAVMKDLSAAPSFDTTKNAERIMTVIDGLRSILQNATTNTDDHAIPTGYMALRTVCLNIRKLIATIEDLSTRSVRCDYTLVFIISF